MVRREVKAVVRARSALVEVGAMSTNGRGSGMRWMLVTLAGCGAALAGCGAAQEVDVVAPGEVPPAGGGGAGAPAATVASEGAGAGDAGASATGAVSAAKAEVSPFVVVAQLPAEAQLRLHPVEGALLLSSEMGLSFEGEEGTSPAVGVLVDGTIDFPKRLRLPGFWHRVVRAMGRWPGPLELVATSDTGRVGIAEQWALKPQGWVQRRSDVGSYFTGVARLGGSVVALKTPAMIGRSELVTLQGPKVTRALTLAPVGPCRGWEPGGQERFEAVKPAAFGATRDGTALSYGKGCDDQVALEVWAPGETRGSIVAMPPMMWRNQWAQLLTGGGEQEAWIVDGDVAHFRDGRATLLEAAVPGDPVNTASVGPDGALWVITDGGALVKRQRDAWERAVLPEGAKAQDVAVEENGTVWVVAGGALLRQGGGEGAAAGALALGGRPGASGSGAQREGAVGSGASAPKPRAPRAFPQAGGPRCTQNLVVLYTFSKVTPDDYDFPLTRKALKGRTEFSGARFVVTRDLGQRFLSAFVPSWDMAKKLQARIQREVQGSTPQVVCASPEVVRELKLDLRTGEISR
ncbi:hypothetical protein [Chondromyces crocatus]|uniref:Uncharacterized protein n=1 Tax=Chondromyces crocatus TaxID=52 RepID=A0A0K1EJG2_CHOCO|nr:hypothetical protein [Chondromyces crocatus]AKT41000.1 uncharacterized protein CMC5_051570 [Chondromyces crocatus]